MTDTLMTILGIFLAVILMFIFPLVVVASQNDEIAQATVETLVADFVNTVAEKGKITEFDYNNFVQKIHATGNTFDIQIEVQLIDDNPERKTVTTSPDITGENLYYSVYTSTILDELNNKGEYNLKNDDYIVVTVKNTNVTLGTQFKNLFYRLIGKNTYTIGSSSSALVTAIGQEEYERVSANIVDEEFEERNIKIEQTLEGITTVNENVSMVVVIDSGESTLKYHYSALPQQLYNMWQSINNSCEDFYIGFITTAEPNKVIMECEKNSAPNVSELTNDVSTTGWDTAIKRAINTVKANDNNGTRKKIVVFLSWGDYDGGRISVNSILAAQKENIDMFYTMACCGTGRYAFPEWHSTMGTKSGGHLGAGGITERIQNIVMHEESINETNTQEVISEDGMVLLEKLDTSKQISIVINDREFILGQEPLTDTSIIVLNGGQYYLNLRKLATQIGKDNLNDTTIKIRYYGIL